MAENRNVSPVEFKLSLSKNSVDNLLIYHFIKHSTTRNLFKEYSWKGNSLFKSKFPNLQNGDNSANLIGLS